MSVSDESVRHYEHQSAESRQRLASTLDELAVKLTPGGVVDELLTYAKAGSGDFFKGLAKSAANNPLPTLLIGVGCAMFLSGRGRMDWSRSGRTDWQPEERRAREYGEYGRDMRGANRDMRSSGGSSAPSRLGSMARSAGETLASMPGAGISGVRHAASAAGAAVGDAAGAAGHAVASTVAGAADQARAGAAAIGSAAGSVAGQVGSGVAAVGDLATGAAHQVAEAAAAATETVGEYAGGLRNTVVERSRQTTQRASQLAESAATLAREQPLLVAAGGLVIGAAIAALLPRSRLEDSMIGETSDAVKEAVGAVASEQYEAAKSAAGRVAGEVMHTAEKEGLTGEAAAGVLRDLGDKMAKVATTGTEAVEGEARDALAKAKAAAS
jgi:hypothetical protein